MGWVYAYSAGESEGDEHEGFVVAVLSDGVDAEPDKWEDSEESGKRGLNWAWSFKYDGEEGRRKAQGLRVICACGWRGARRPADFADPDTCDAQLQQEWDRHCELSLYQMPTHRLRRLISELDEVFDELSGGNTPDGEPARPLLAAHMATSLQRDLGAWQRDAVRAARKGGFSWDEIAGPLAMSKQSAHEKFAKHVQAGTQEKPS
ncbi:hypothetical protein [Streptomyces noursei]|uniref:hypothetical protein n=1 Tax=Streptomyces noursei TaxID=1971 RepID=UPI0016745FE9|nr:hypothetical protein [Streptomyces noursei]MCZ1021077.1 hypothetical protein [Streptomyces noursei]GGX55578.1 hypothetical protein GCM10010341_90480 [Streptomyces noursei]